MSKNNAVSTYLELLGLLPYGMRSLNIKINSEVVPNGPPREKITYTLIHNGRDSIVFTDTSLKGILSQVKDKIPKQVVEKPSDELSVALESSTEIVDAVESGK